jgi:chemotaxis protein methyltransferase CheR
MLRQRRRCRRRLFLDADFIMAHFAAGNLALRGGKTQQTKRHWNNALQLLRRCAPEALVPESEDMTAGHLQEVISAALEASQ